MTNPGPPAPGNVTSSSRHAPVRAPVPLDEPAGSRTVPALIALAALLAAAIATAGVVGTRRR